jgi:linoleate 10R-lipoxygenase
MSEWDEEWTTSVFKDNFPPGTNLDELSLKDFKSLGSIFAKVEPDPSKRNFANLQRGPDGRFKDEDLANILIHATSVPAGSYGGRSTPPILRLVEIMAIEQSRAWGVCTMNEFRRFLGLKQFESFEEWNPDPEIAGAARQLYGHISNLELYVSRFLYV